MLQVLRTRPQDITEEDGMTSAIPELHFLEPWGPMPSAVEPAR